MAAPFVSDPEEPVRENYFKQLHERSADPSDDAGHVAQLEEDGFLAGAFVGAIKRQLHMVSPNDDTKPYAVTDYGGVLSKALAANTYVGRLNRFSGFAKGLVAAQADITLLNYLNRTAGQTYDAPAGANRMLMVAVDNATSSSGFEITGISFGGTPLTKVLNINGNLYGNTNSTDGSGFSIWLLPLGTSASITSGAMAITYEGAGSGAVLNCYTLENVRQNAAVVASNTAAHNQSTNPLLSISANLSCINAIVFGNIQGQGVEGLPTSLGGLISRNTHSNTTHTYRSFKTSGAQTTGRVAVIALLPATGSLVDYQEQGIVHGFTGLIPGQRYFLSSTVQGEISTTGSIYVGTALNETTLLVPRAQKRAIGSYGISDVGSGGATQARFIETDFLPSKIVVSMSEGNGTQTGGSGETVYFDGVQVSRGGAYSAAISGISEEGFTITVTQAGATPIAGNVVWQAEE